jgi:prephenate dehydrogenase
LKELKQITVIGLGLLGGSITRSVCQGLPAVKTVGYSHRPSTRIKARRLAIAHQVVETIAESVAGADIVILATPIYTFEQIFQQIADHLPAGCIVTDVGSTKVLPCRWAAKYLPDTVHYVGSHPIAGSEQRGLEFARDDLFERTYCILTRTNKTNGTALQTLKEFWMRLGCIVKIMSPVMHDKILANISHLPHVAAAALVNLQNKDELKLAGKGFVDTSRVASGPANIWTDILLTNTKNVAGGIDKTIAELKMLQRAIKKGDRGELEKLLNAARTKRNAMIKYKMKKRELIQ